MGKRNALRNRVIDRLTIEKQKKTIHEISNLLEKNRLEVDFQSLKDLITPHEIDLAKTAVEFATLETKVKELHSDPRTGSVFSDDA